MKTEIWDKRNERLNSNYPNLSPCLGKGRKLLGAEGILFRLEKSEPEDIKTKTFRGKPINPIYWK